MHPFLSLFLCPFPTVAAITTLQGESVAPTSLNMNLHGAIESNNTRQHQRGNVTTVPAAAAAAAAAASLTNAKQATTMSNPVETHSVSRRLQSELMALMTCGDPGVSAFPDGDNIFAWIGTIKGSTGTVYEGLSYKLSLRFSNEYPFKPPIVKFDTPCFHPNVDQNGNICLDILQDKWSSAYDVRTVLLSIQSLLGEPNNDSPLNNIAAILWPNQEEYRRIMQKQYKDAGGAIGHH